MIAKANLAHVTHRPSWPVYSTSRALGAAGNPADDCSADTEIVDLGPKDLVPVQFRETGQSASEFPSLDGGSEKPFAWQDHDDGSLAGKVTTAPDEVTGEEWNLSPGATGPLSSPGKTLALTSHRYARCQGTAWERGRRIGEHTREGILALIDRKLEVYDGDIDLWRKIANPERVIPLIEHHAPITYQQMLGTASVDGLDMEKLLLLTCDYEMHMASALLPKTDGKCTAFAASGEDGGNLVCGQTNDETLHEWVDGSHDTVLHLRDGGDGLQTFIYTHPGIPAYMGMNSDGLCILWQYVENGERNLEVGVPTNVMLAEALTKSTIEEALEYLRDCPRTVPNNFMLVREGEGMVNVESTPSRFSVKRELQGDLCHANHFVFDKELVAQDTGVLSPTTTTIARQEKMEELIHNRSVSVGIGKEALSTSPIDCERTLAAMVFDPANGEMHIRFKGDPKGVFRVHKFD